MNKPKPTKYSSVVFNQLCKLIPNGMVRNLATEYEVDKKSRTFSPWSHVVSLLYCQLTHSIGLNDLAMLYATIALSCLPCVERPRRVVMDSRMRTKFVMPT